MGQLEQLVLRGDWELELEQLLLYLVGVLEGQLEKLVLRGHWEPELEQLLLYLVGVVGVLEELHWKPVMLTLQLK